MEMNNDDELQLSALHLSELGVEGRRHLTEEHSASFRWLMASFLAMNGAGLISLKDIKLSDPTHAFIGGIAFFVGIVFALLIAFLGQKSNQKMLDPVARMSLYWRGVATTGILNQEVQQDIDDRMSVAMKSAKWPSRSGFLSLLFFAFGLAVIAHGWVAKSG